MDQELQDISQSHSESSADLPPIIQDCLLSGNDFDPFSPLPLSVQFPSLDSPLEESNVDSSLKKLSIYMRKRTKDLEQIVEEDSVQPEFSDMTEITPSDFRKKSSFLDSIGQNNLASSNEYELEPESIYRTAAKRNRSSQERIARRRTIELNSNPENPQPIIVSKLNFSEETYEIKTESTNTKHTQDLFNSDGKMKIPMNYLSYSSPSEWKCSQDSTENQQTVELTDLKKQESRKIVFPKIQKISRFDANNLFKKKKPEDSLQSWSRIIIQNPKMIDKIKLTCAARSMNEGVVQRHKANLKNAQKKESIQSMHIPLDKAFEHPELFLGFDKRLGIPRPVVNDRSHIDPSKTQTGKTLLQRRKTQQTRAGAFSSQTLKVEPLSKPEINPPFSERKFIVNKKQKPFRTPIRSFKYWTFKSPAFAKKPEPNVCIASANNRARSYHKSARFIFNSSPVNKMLPGSALNNERTKTFTHFFKKNSISDVHPSSENRDCYANSENRNQQNRPRVIDYVVDIKNLKELGTRQSTANCSSSSKKLAAINQLSHKLIPFMKETRNRKINNAKVTTIDQQKNITKLTRSLLVPSQISHEIDLRSSLATLKHSHSKNVSVFHKKISQKNAISSKQKIQTKAASQKERSRQSVSQIFKHSFGSESLQLGKDVQRSTIEVCKRHSMQEGPSHTKLRAELELYAFLPSDPFDSRDYCPLFEKLKEISAALRASKVDIKSSLSSRRCSKSNENSLL